MEELKEFSRKLHADQQQRQQQQGIQLQLQGAIWRELHHHVVLAITPQIEELRERLNLFILYIDIEKNPSAYTVEEKEFIKASVESWIKTSREFMREFEEKKAGENVGRK